MRKIRFLIRGMVVTARDMFTGFILGICAAVLLARVNPSVTSAAALFIPAGIMAGFFKGASKFIFLNIFSALPSKGYRYNYPKFKLLLLWGVLLAASLVYSYGLNFRAWFSGPLALIRENILMGAGGEYTWPVVFAAITLAGIGSYLYEPPFNEDEFLPDDTADGESENEKEHE